MFLALQVLIGLLLALSILIQQRAAGLSATFGGMGASYVQRRGAELLLYRTSIGLGAAFFGLGILQMLL
jgi:protein translocase SecG subunit